MERRIRLIPLSELKEHINIETVGCREDGAFMDVLYNEIDNEITITYFDQWHFCEDVVIQLDK